VIAGIPFTPAGGDPTDPAVADVASCRAFGGVARALRTARSSMERISFSLGVLVVGAALSACDDAGDGGTGGTGGAAATTGTAPASSTSTATGNGGAGGDGIGGNGSVGGPVGPGAPACDLAPPPGDVPCEALGDGRCFYIDAANGDDATGDGSHATPWRTLANVVSYYGTPGENGSTAAPPSAIDLAPGDVVYLRAGTYDQLYNYQGELLVARFRQVSGAPGEPISLVAYPGEQPVVDPGGAGVGVDVLQASHFRIRGIEVMNGYGAGVRVSDAEDVVLTHLHVHDTDGIDNDNIAGVYLVGASGVEVACSEIHDNYDRENADTGGEATENSSNVVAFGGGDLRVHHNHIFQTPEHTASKTGGCVKYKHAATDSDAVFEVDHNVISRCKFFGVGTGTQHTHVHRNVITEGEGIVSRDFGGPTHQVDQVFEHNTLYRASGFHLSPTTDWNDATLEAPSGIVYTNNVVLHPLESPSQERGVVVIGTYGSDALHDATLPALTFATNCYSNPSGALNFSFFAANGGSYGAEGAQHDLAGWQGLGLDAGSVDADPMLVDPEGADYRTAADGPCAAMGALAP
jgi:hypothetical protein